jgi:hypothetical protein
MDQRQRDSRPYAGNAWLEGAHGYGFYEHGRPINDG